MIVRLGLSRQITLVDKYIPNEEAHVLFSAADLLVAPYVDGTQSGAVEVALGYGLPAIVTDPIAAGTAESNTARLRVVPAGNVAALAEALETELACLPTRAVHQPAQDDWWRLVGCIEEMQGKIVLDARNSR
jgi:glycosyltransferase involved in cell wall biosynthesis